MPRENNPIRHQMKIYAPAALVVIAAFVLAFQFIKPAPPKHVVMATGGPEGAYHQFGRRYAAYLAREGITLELRPTAGSVENLELLRSGEVSLALVQGGVNDGRSDPEVFSLGSVYYEPLWLFSRKSLFVQRLGALAGRRITTGPEGSGTRALAVRLLRDNGIAETSDWVAKGGGPQSMSCSPAGSMPPSL
jgi:TRAP-type uncharacterized transport system substrate-binding protein